MQNNICPGAWEKAGDAVYNTIEFSLNATGLVKGVNGLENAEDFTPSVFTNIVGIANTVAGWYDQGTTVLFGR